MSSSSIISLPEPLRRLFNAFPLYTYPGDDKVNASTAPSKPTLWIVPPPENGATSFLSDDVECLKWQAYLSLRGVSEFDIRWDISEDAGVDGHLPALHLPTKQLLSTSNIPAWVDSIQGPLDDLEGYRDGASRDESRAWVTLLEGNVHAAIALQKPKWTMSSIMTKPIHTSLESLIHPTPPPLSGLSMPFPPSGARISTPEVQMRYKEAMWALSERLGQDTWFLGSPMPTALDALAFAYLHTALRSADSLRSVVEGKSNLVAWEKRVLRLVQQAGAAKDYSTQQS